MPFYHFHQNNTGGYFIFDEKQGISCNVIIEGDNLDEIIKRAKAIGIYFDGCKKGYDCRCCGDRWTRPWPDEPLDKVPTQYGKRVYPNQSYLKDIIEERSVLIASNPALWDSPAEIALIQKEKDIVESNIRYSYRFWPYNKKVAYELDRQSRQYRNWIDGGSIPS